ncbi:hypothetical protein [Microbacterium aquimaris]|uniref:Uncharacterized protein n=1 Tax=Microbacterium aquimaris TaxID=459816 RepID=A0ABU5N2T3_9MICO|nr:hypothetical protein [Microbacterium aquimaris]MAP64905.1 hypothetical protein [Microbacterium sp.]MDZ8160212.1 hypothetical protein [Microbacterium aquimaris]MDZ8276766.1 hypothetical protein [Microbacterium aquimaris]|tara:strand:- start:650 stop:874 length:225 start_codon:yes stop_codon:yes gene_type:complete
MSEPRTGFPRGRLQWLLGTVLLFALGVLFGMILQNVWLGVILAGAISIGWLIAYESWRGRHVGLDDPDDDGAQI